MPQKLHKELADLQRCARILLPETIVIVSNKYPWFDQKGDLRWSSAVDLIDPWAVFALLKAGTSVVLLGQVPAMTGQPIGHWHGLVALALPESIEQTHRVHSSLSAIDRPPADDTRWQKGAANPPNPPLYAYRFSGFHEFRMAIAKT
jgi:hypothetical protein